MAKDKRQAPKATRKAKSDNSALIELIDPPEKRIPYDPKVMEALNRRWEKDQARRLSDLQFLKRQLYLGIFPWWVSEIKNANLIEDGWESRVAAVEERADRKWTDLSGLPPLVTVRDGVFRSWDGVNWRRAAALAQYNGNDERIIVDGLIACFVLSASDRRNGWQFQPASNGNNSTAITSNDARDKWLYEQCCNGVAYQTIVNKLKAINWEPIDSPQGIKKAANRYANTHDLPEIPKRQPGRPPK